MPRLATLIEISGYALAVVFALVVDPRILIAEAAIGLVALGQEMGKRP
jgi:hypothetical protein